MEETNFGLSLLNVIFPYIEMFVSGILAAATPFAIRYFINWLKSKSHSAAFSCAMDKAEKMTLLGFEVAQQTYVEQRKTKAADGKLTPEEAKEALSIASRAALSSLGQRQLAEIQGCLGLARNEVEALFERMIEMHIKKNKDLKDLRESTKKPLFKV
jgi:hypothetical protein